MNSLLGKINKFYTNIPSKRNIMGKYLFCIFDSYKSDDWKKYLASTDKGLVKNKYLITDNEDYRLYVKVLNFGEDAMGGGYKHQVKKLLKGDIIHTEYYRGGMYKLNPDSIFFSEQNTIHKHQTYSEKTSFMLVMEDKTGKI